MKFDPLDPKVMADPFTYYAWLRENAPVYWVESMQFFAVSRHADVVALSQDNKTFSSSAFWATLFGEFDPVPETPSLLGLDGPAHTRMRRLANKALGGERVRAFDQRIADVTSELIDEIIARHGPEGSFDFFWDFAALFPTTIMAEILGVDPGRRVEFKHWVDDVMASPYVSPDDTERRTRMKKHSLAFRAFVEEIYEDRCKNPGDDLVSWLVEARVDGEALTKIEVLSTVTVLLVGGADTTTNLLCSVMALCQMAPDIYARVRDDIALVPRLIDETLRYLGPVQGVFRHATCDTEIAGVKIPAGSMVSGLIASANRDPSVFENPDVIDIDRPFIGLMSFNQGPHFCIGAPLARLETRISLELLFQKFAQLEVLDNPIKWGETFHVRGPHHLPVRYVAAESAASESGVTAING